jgi:hypothetical protein
VATQGNLTVDAASALGCNAATNTLAAVNITDSVAGAQTVLRSIAGVLDESIAGHEIRESGPPPLDLSKIDFSTVKEQMIDGDEGRKNAVREISISASKPGR